MNYYENLRELKTIFRVFNNKELAEKLEITEDAVKAWAKRKSIPSKYLDLIQKQQYNNITNKEIISNSIQFRLLNKKQTSFNNFQHQIILLHRCLTDLLQQKKEFDLDEFINFIKNYKISLIKDLFQNAITENTKKSAIAFLYELQDEEINFICSEPERFLEYLWSTRNIYHQIVTTDHSPV